MSSFGPPPGPDPNRTQPLPKLGAAPPPSPLGPAPVPPAWNAPPGAPTGAMPAGGSPGSPLPGGPGRPAGPAPRVKTPKGAGTRLPSSATYGNVVTYLLARLAAFLIDVPILAFAVVAFAFGQLKLDTRMAIPAAQSSFPFIAISSLLGVLAFAMLCEGIVGTTLGKALFALHVHKARGGYAGLGRAIVRAVIRPIDLLAIGPVLAAVTPRHQRLGDFAAGTTVARSPVGALAPVIAFVLLAGIGYAQFAFGGGLDSAIAVAAETSFFAPVVENDVAGAAAAVLPMFHKPGPQTPASGGPLPLGSTAAPGSPSSPEPSPEGSPAVSDSAAPAGSATAAPAGETPQQPLPEASTAAGATFPPDTPAGPAAASPAAEPSAGTNEAASPAPAENGAAATPV